jgi:hypothetical protein
MVRARAVATAISLFACTFGAACKSTAPTTASASASPIRDTSEPEDLRDASSARDLVVCGAVLDQAATHAVEGDALDPDHLPPECRGLGLTTADLADVARRVAGRSTPLDLPKDAQPAGFSIDVDVLPLAGGCRVALEDKRTYDLGSTRDGSAKLKAALARALVPFGRANVRADTEVPRACVMRVVALLRDAGAKKIALGATTQR